MAKAAKPPKAKKLSAETMIALAAETLKAEIVPGLSADDVRLQFGDVSLAKDGCVEISRSSEMLNVRAITFKVSFQLGEREVVCLKRKQPEAVPRASVKRHQPARVVFRGSGNGYDIEIDAVLLAKR